MNREQILANLSEKLDIDKNGRVNLNDVAIYVTEMNNRKWYAVGLACFAVGALLGWLLG